MASTRDTYTKEIHQQFKPLFANWHPGEPRQLGDYGPIQGNFFERRGNITNDHQIRIASQTGPMTDYDYRSGKGVEVALIAKGSTTVDRATAGKAGMQVNFSRRNAIFFRAAGCKFTSINNLRQVLDHVSNLYAKGDWDRNHAIVDTIVRAGATYVIISGSRSASISLEASADVVQDVDLADTTLRLAVRAESDIALRIIGKHQRRMLTPLLGMKKLEPENFRAIPLKGGPANYRFAPEFRSIGAPRAMSLDSIRNTVAILPSPPLVVGRTRDISILDLINEDAFARQERVVSGIGGQANLIVFEANDLRHILEKDEATMIGGYHFTNPLL